MKIIVFIDQRDKIYEETFNLADKHILSPDAELYTTLKEWFGRQIYNAHKRELERKVKRERS